MKPSRSHLPTWPLLAVGGVSLFWVAFLMANADSGGGCPQLSLTALLVLLTACVVLAGAGEALLSFARSRNLWRAAAWSVAGAILGGALAVVLLLVVYGHGGCLSN